LAKTILVVDDSDISRMIATRALQGAGYEILEANNGSAALALLEGRKVSMAVCDFNMPVMDGIEFVQAIRVMPKHKSMPVVMLTVADEPEILEKGKEAGVNAWMTKPFSFNDLVGVVGKLCP
jgi:two-component system chemotaxis response regulator CheY